HRVAADPEALYVVPAHGSTALRVPLRQEVPPPVLRRDDRPRTVVRSAFDVRRFTHGGDTVTDLTVRLALRPHGEASDAPPARGGPRPPAYAPPDPVQPSIAEPGRGI
ncbi:hypothetical protein ACFTY7_44575, partial [Streptomyces sp. NPDC057062]|uniref:hypothetical protein n=1 Tax=Streptomyces sp. NPDC057062 TaxID=3346011 RepID=UPI003626A994